MTVPPRRRFGCSPWTLMGCGCGLLSIIGIILVFLLLWTLALREMQDPAWNRLAYQQCQHNMQAIAVALRNYQVDYHRLPSRLDQLLSHHLASPQALDCPLHRLRGSTPYRYTATPSGPTDPLVTCDNHGQGPVVLLHNGRLRIDEHIWRDRKRPHPAYD